MKNEKILLSWFGLLNFILACLVVLIHTYNANSYGLIYNNGVRSTVLLFEDFFSHDIAHIAVPLFFSISGYLYFRTVTYSNIKDKMARRIHTLCIPYLVWNFVYLVLFFILSQIPFLRDNVNSLQSFNFDFNTLLSAILFHKYNYIMWFVYQLIIYVFLLSPFLIYVLNNRFLSGLVVCILGVVYSFGFLEIPKLSEYTMAVGIFPDMLAYFIIGGILAKNDYNFSSKGMMLGGAIIIIAQLLWLFNYSGYKLWHYNALNFAFCSLSIIGIFMALANTKTQCPKIGWTSCSFFIFTIHPFLLECIQKLVYLALPHNELSALLDYVISPTVTISICVMIAMQMRKIAMPLYSFLGGR